MRSTAYKGTILFYHIMFLFVTSNFIYLHLTFCFVIVLSFRLTPVSACKPIADTDKRYTCNAGKVTEIKIVVLIIQTSTR